MIIDVARVEAFLATRFGSDGSDVVHLSTGVWSKAFAFHRQVATMSSASVCTRRSPRTASRTVHLPCSDPRVVELGEAFGAYYAISERVYGGVSRRRR